MSQATPNVSSAQFEKQIVSLLKLVGDLKMVILFGSMASHTENSDSDLDLAVLYDQELGLIAKKELMEQLALLSGRPVDLIDLKTVGEPLLGQIVVTGKRLFGSDSEFGRLLSKHLIEQADFLPYRTRILEERRAAWIEN